MFQPNTLPPSTSGAISTLVFPSRRFSICYSFGDMPQRLRRALGASQIVDDRGGVLRRYRILVDHDHLIHDLLPNVPRLRGLRGSYRSSHPLPGRPETSCRSMGAPDWAISTRRAARRDRRAAGGWRTKLSRPEAGCGASGGPPQAATT